jgi:hypothetical protein
MRSAHQDAAVLGSKRSPGRSTTVLRQARISHKCASLRRLFGTPAQQRLGGLQQTSIRRTQGSVALSMLRRPHAHHRDLLAGATAEAPPDAASAEGQDRHPMTTSQPPPRKAVRLSARSPAGHGSVRSNAAFTTLQPHRSSATLRPGDHKNASHPSCNAIATTHPTSLPTSAAARPRRNPHS